MFYQKCRINLNILFKKTQFRQSVNIKLGFKNKNNKNYLLTSKIGYILSRLYGIVNLVERCVKNYIDILNYKNYSNYSK